MLYLSLLSNWYYNSLLAKIIRQLNFNFLKNGVLNLIRVAEVTFSGFPSDPRPRRETEALRDAGMEIDMYCLKSESFSEEENYQNIRVKRLGIEKKRVGKARYILQYAQFILTMFFLLGYNQLKRGYKIIHIHNMPDALVFSALIPKVFGTKIILDLHDPMPEMFATKFSLEESHIAIKLLILLERLSIKFSDIVLTPNISFKNKFISRGCPPSKIHIIMNSPQEEIFHRNGEEYNSEVNKDSSKYVIMYHGSVVERHGLDDALKAMVLLRDKIPGLEFRVFGPGEYTEKFLQLVKELNLNDIVNYIGKVPLERIANEIPKIDLGLIPNKLNPFTNINFPTRIFEYLCLNKPVIVPSTVGIKDYFNDDSIFFFEPNNPKSLSETILKIYTNPELSQNTTKKGVEIYKKFKWKIQKMELVQIVENLVK